MAHDEIPVEGETFPPVKGGPQLQGDSALTVARHVLVRVEAGAYATLALSGELARSRLQASGRALCTELVYGTLRRQARLDRALLALAPRGLSKIDTQVRALLRLGAYQLLFTRVPPHVAVSQVIETVRKLRGPRLAGFVNALLRRLAREGEPPLPPLPPLNGPKSTDLEFAEALANRNGLPVFLVADLLAQEGRAETVELCAALESPAPLWLRINLLRGTKEAALLALARESIDVDRQPTIPALPEAVRVSSGSPFFGEAYGQGWFTAQDLGAQLVARLLLADTAEGPLALPPGAILDACCGVGGKTTHLAALTGNRRPIDAADSLPRKLELCRDHAHRLGCSAIKTLEVDLLDPATIKRCLRPSYAAVLLDAPCSGTGVLRRHPEARQRLTEPQVRELCAMQKTMLDNLAPYVEHGGVLVYAVCSFLTAEGPDQVTAFLRQHSDFTLLPPPQKEALWKDVPWPLRTLPHRHDADGFYAVRLQRK